MLDDDGMGLGSDLDEIGSPDRTAGNPAFSSPVEALGRDTGTMMESKSRSSRSFMDDGITENRESNFGMKTGRFRDPDDGTFERGSAPPDYSSETNRYRSDSGQFKSRSSDLFDEPAEVFSSSLAPKG